MKNVIVVGSSNTDLVVTTQVIPQPGETILGAGFRIFQGGKGANQAVAAARAGANVTFIARVGKDDMGDNAITGYRNEKINTDFIARDTGLSTGVAVITVNVETGENSILVAAGANSSLSSDDIYRAADQFTEGGVFLCQLEIPLESVLAGLQLARKRKLITILNPAPARELPTDFWPLIDIITPNESETEILCGLRPDSPNTMEQAADILLKKVGKAVIITLGEKGAFIADKQGGRYLVPARKVKAVDSTAAGDVFNGYLAASLASEIRLEDAVSIANNAASFSVTTPGAQPSIPRLDQL